jgi:hypothetical protein
MSVSYGSAVPPAPPGRGQAGSCCQLLVARTAVTTRVDSYSCVDPSNAPPQVTSRSAGGPERA